MERLTIVLILGLFGGCASPQIRPNDDIEQSFAAIDVIQIEAVGKTLTIEDRETIERIRHAYGRSQWDRVPTTMPADLVKIHGLEHGVRKFKLLYGAGWIMDTDPESGKILRLGTLSGEDREWMHENIRSKLPPNPGII